MARRSSLRKHSSRKARSRAAGADELGDDGKMGYAQRMEMELAIQMGKAPENVPVFTVEGAPLSDNVKKWKNDAIKKALDYCAATGGKFEDSGPGGFPEAAGSAPCPSAPPRPASTIGTATPG